MSRRRSRRDFEQQLPVPIAPWECPTRKRGYHTRADAKAWLGWLQRSRHPGDRVEAREYRCQHSDKIGLEHYHVTSDSQRGEVAS